MQADISSGEDSAATVVSQAGMTTVLMLTHRLPYAPNRGDRIRAYHILHALRDSVRVSLLSLVHDAAEAAHAGEVGKWVDTLQVVPVPWGWTRRRGVLALPTRAPLTHRLLDSPAASAAIRRIVRDARPDVVLAYGSGMARFALESPLKDLPLVLDMVDCDSRKWAELGVSTAGPLGWVYRREARVLAEFEARALRAARVTTVVNAREEATLRDIAPEAHIRVVPNGIDTQAMSPTVTPSSTETVVFCGVMNYPPNELGALWVAREVWPHVRRRRPQARLLIVGSSPTRRIAALPTLDGSVTVTGEVPDVRPFLWQSAVAVAPLRTARGVQNKVLESIAAGLPTVVTRAVAEGLPPVARHACSVADGAEDFAAAIVNYLNRSPRERRRLAAQADLSSLCWRRSLAPLVELVRAEADGRTP